MMFWGDIRQLNQPLRDNVAVSFCPWGKRMATRVVKRVGLVKGHYRKRKDKSGNVGLTFVKTHARKVTKKR